jgi:hypothetical protein
MAISKRPFTFSGKANREVMTSTKGATDNSPGKTMGNDVGWIQAPDGTKETSLFFSDLAEQN